MNFDRIPVLGRICKNIDGAGEDFFLSGRLLVGFLDRLGRNLKHRQFHELEKLYSPAFRGELLGLNNPYPVSERDGIHRAEIRSPGRRGSKNRMS